MDDSFLPEFRPEGRVVSAEEIRSEHRRVKIAEGIQMGYTSIVKLAEYAGCTKDTAKADCAIIDERLRREGIDLASRGRSREFAKSYFRLEYMISRVYEKLKETTEQEKLLPLVAEMRRLDESKRNLLGSDKPKKTALTDPTGEEEYSGGRFSHAFRQRLEDAGAPVQDVQDADIVDESTEDA